MKGYNGSITYSSKKGKGFQIDVILPINVGIKTEVKKDDQSIY